MSLREKLNQVLQARQHSLISQLPVRVKKLLPLGYTCTFKEKYQRIEEITLKDYDVKIISRPEPAEDAHLYYPEDTVRKVRETLQDQLNSELVEELDKTMTEHLRKIRKRLAKGMK